MINQRNWWHANENMVIGDTSTEENPPIDSFKAVHYPKPAPKEVTEKAFTKNMVR